MYLPDIFCEKDTQHLLDLIDKKPLATMISHDSQGELWVDMLPFFVSQDDKGETMLLAHLAKNNPSCQWLDGQSLLLLFYGEQGYVSPNYYPSKFIHHRHVPTWNYQVVEVRGRASVFDDKKLLMALLGRLTNKHEATQKKPWAMKDAPRDYLTDELDQIIGIKVTIERMIGKYKLSQNRSPDDLAGTVAGLNQSGQTALAEQVAKVYPTPIRTDDQNHE